MIRSPRLTALTQISQLAIKMQDMKKTAWILFFTLCLAAGSSAGRVSGVKHTPDDIQAEESGQEQQVDCFTYDMDISGSELNDGVQAKYNTAAECQTHCTTVAKSSYFTWTSTSFSNPAYHYGCWCSEGNNMVPSVGDVSGPNYCKSSSQCCNTLQVASFGSITTSGQSHVLGTYVYHSTSASGHVNYQQQGIGGSYLYFYAPLQMWMIGSVIGMNSAYATSPGTANCAEYIQKTWDYWVPATNSWIQDETMTTYCVDSAPPPSNDACMTGAACNGCFVSLDLLGTTYCCSNNCDFGWIYVNNGNCYCGH